MVRRENLGCAFLLRELFCLLCLSLSALAGTDQPANVILITLDTTRADRMGFLGSDRGLTPNLDALARQSVVFTRAYAQAPMTTTSHASILTGTYPQFHKVRDFAYALGKDLPYAPAILHNHGYETAAFLGSLVLDASVSAPGFDRGFDTYDAPFHAKDVWHDASPATRRPGSEVVAHALGWLTHHPQGPFLLWVHLFDAHETYNPPEPYKTRYASDLYDGGIAYEDSVVGELLRELKTRGLFEGTAIAVMADHGESLGAHGEETHGVFLYDETIQVPLVIKLPGGVGAGRRVENRVELVDVMPTMLQVAKIDVPAAVQGASLLPLMEAEGGVADAWRDRPAYAQSDYPQIAYGLSALESLRTGKYLYVQAPRRELYDEAADAKAEHNLAAEMPAVADTVGGQLKDFRSKTSSTREAPKSLEDPRAEEKLLALGYVMQGNDFSSAKALGQGADPKDYLNLFKDISHLGALMRADGVDAAISILQQQIAAHHNVPTLYVWLGDCYRKKHQYDKAVSALRQAVQLGPNSMIAEVELGLALEEKGDFSAAIPEFEKVVAAMPQSQEWRLDLAGADVHANRLPQAIRQYDEVLKINSNNFFARLLLGKTLLLSGDAAASLTHLKKASALRPEDPAPHKGLALAYSKLGRKTEAEQEEATAAGLEPRSQDETSNIQLHSAKGSTR